MTPSLGNFITSLFAGAVIALAYWWSFSFY
jgi:hypothetical protein